MNDILTRLAALTAKDENGLLPCQCGGSAKTKESYNNAHLLNIRCKKCGLLITARRDQAAEKWNTRPRETALIALVQEATKEIERLKEWRDVALAIAERAEAQLAEQPLNPTEAA